MPLKFESKSRSWGTRFDHLSSPPPPPPPPLPSTVKDHRLDASIKMADKMPHDASVFVGSLPSNIEQQELTRLLSEHLAEHTEVKNIKVVRDSKGGVCAFVQCEDASSAARLIHALHSTNPKPFLGHLLRYERARAFRTLLVSYRTPVQFIHSNTSATASTVEKQVKNVELNLPSAMRLWKPWNAKYMTILYNKEAHNQNGEVPGLFLHPLTFDEETIRKMALQFGPLEKFEPLSTAFVASDGSYPAPHNGPRSPCMDNRCWEIKWDHRDDCVSALMALRRVPHLTVTWAHQPNSSSFDHQNATRFSYQNATPYLVHEPAETSSTDVSIDEGCKIMNSQGPKDSTFLPSREGNNEIKKSANWSELDFPPLGDPKAERKAESGVWGDKKLSKAETEDIKGSPSGSSLLSLSATPRVASAQLFNLADTGETTSREDQELDMPPTPELGRSPLSPKTPGSLFPDTPTSYLGDFQDSFNSLHQKDRKENLCYSGDTAPAERELDPTTLFVGGLEMYGPNAWDQEKVRSFFSRFSGLEHVTFVRPVSSRSGFAFVKFNNTESPARAISEEHNRVYEGRQMRIQLRDCNPPHRGMWKYGRGRGRYQHYGAQRHSAEPEPVENSNEITHPDLCPKNHPSDEHRGFGSKEHQGETVLESDGISVDAPEFPTLDKAATTSAFSESRTQAETEDRSSHSPVSETRQSSPDKLSTTKETPSQYREWYEEPFSSPITPPPSSLGSSASATTPTAGPFVSYPVPNLGYYPPPNWMPPLAHHAPYPIPYMPGFHGFPPAPANPAPQSFQSTTGSDASGPAAGTQNTWGGVYTPCMSYPTRAPNIGQSQPQPPQKHGQPPLLPTGFIQGDQGSLIAIYHPEALDQYMSTAQQGSTPSTQAQQPTVPAWNPQTSVYPFPVPPFMMAQQFPGAQGQPRPGVGWMPGLAPLPYAGLQNQQYQAGPATFNRAPPNFRGGYFGGQSHTLPTGKRQHRRDHYNSNRSQHPRGQTNRFPRGEGQQPAAPPQLNTISGDWTQWAVGHKS